MMHRWFMLSAVMALGTISPAHAADIAAGKTAALLHCSDCHGLTGVSHDEYFPNLAGQKEQYLITQLKAFKAGKRKNPEMNVATKLITATDIANVAAYFASQRCSPKRAEKSDIAAGKTTALLHCYDCHGLTGVSPGEYFPTIAGQKEPYLTMQLKAFKAGKRKNPEMNLVTKLLTATDIANVAAYFASQRCSPKRAEK